jgi:glycine oxidase
MAQIRNPRHLQALIVACAARGVELRPHVPALRLECNGKRTMAAHTPDGPYRADKFLICAGAWTDILLDPLGVRIESRPIRGQIVLLRSQIPLIRRIILAGKLYLVPRDDGRILVGSTEEDAGFDPSTTAEAAGDLLGFATRIVPGLRRVAVERCWAGLRPGSPDGLPTLGRVAGMDNLWVAAGHFRAGLQLSAATGLVMAEALTGRRPTIPLDPFQPDRPPGTAVRPTFRS